MDCAQDQQQNARMIMERHFAALWPCSLATSMEINVRSHAIDVDYYIVLKQFQNYIEIKLGI